MLKTTDKEKILKAAREKLLMTYKKTPIRLKVHFSTETMEARRWWDIFKMLKEKNQESYIQQCYYSKIKVNKYIPR